jgi:hypothetical protein
MAGRWAAATCPWPPSSGSSCPGRRDVGLQVLLRELELLEEPVLVDVDLVDVVVVRVTGPRADVAHFNGHVQLISAASLPTGDMRHLQVRMNI